MRLAWPVVAILAARFLVLGIAYPQGDGDLSWQRWLGAEILRTGSIPHALGGETFSAPGAPWVAHEWLFSLGAALGRSGAGWYAFAGFVAACAIAAVALAAYRGLRFGASPRAVALCTVFAGIALFDSYGVRVQVVAWPLAILFVMLLESERPVAWLALPVAALWSNVHASAAIAPALAALVALGVVLDARRVTPRAIRAGALALGSLGAICLNPFGVGLPAYALMLVRSPITQYITEWKPSGLEDSGFLYGALPLLAIVLFAGAGRAKNATMPWEAILLAAAFFWLSLGAARNVALLGLVALPLAARGLTVAIPWFAAGAAPAPPRSARERIASAGIPAFSLGLAVVVAAMLLRSGARDDVGLATPALAALDRAGGTRRVFCTDFAWCGLLVGDPHARVFLDGRADPYPLRVWNDYVDIAGLRPQWRARLDAYGVNAVVAGRDGALDQALALTAGWRSAYADARYRLWLRAPARRAGRGEARSAA